VSADGVTAAAPNSAEEYDALKAEQQQQTATLGVEALDPEAETILSNINSKLTQGIASAALGEIMATGDLSHQVADLAAEKLGVTPAEARQQAATVRASFEAQAARAVGDGSELIFGWAREHANADLRAAINEQVNVGTLGGYKSIAKQFYASLDQHTPAAILESPMFAQYGARRERDGTITLQFPEVGRVSWGVAFRAGLITMKR